MKVGIVVLSHNALDVTKKFLNSLVKNTDSKSFILYFIDNGSTDETPSYLIDWKDNNFCETEVRLEPTNTGVIGGRNIGFNWFLSEKRCDHLLFLDNDQFVRSGWLEHHLSVLSHGYDLVGVEAWKINSLFLPKKYGNTISINSKLHIKQIKSTYEDFSYVGCGGMLIKREAIEEVGGFDDRFNPSYFEDPDYCFSLLKAGKKIGWNLKARVVHLPHQTLGVASDKIKRFNDSYRKFLKKWNGHKIESLRQKYLEEFDE